MANKLIAARDKFVKYFPETRTIVNSRDWGLIHCAGLGPNLLLLPGTLGRADIFWQQIDALKGRVNILALSYPATGSLEEWADDIRALMDNYNFTTASILGSSLGGYLAQYFAATNPQRVDNLIAANTLSCVQVISQLPPYSFDLDETPIDTLRGGFEVGMKASLQDNPERADLVELLLQEVGGRIPEQELRARLKALKFGPQLPRISIPAPRIFTVESDDDPLIPPPMRDAVREKLNPARAYHFATGSHFPYVTQPRDYTTLIKQCLHLGLHLENANSNWPTGKTTTL